MRNQNRAASFDQGLIDLAKAAENAPKDAAIWKQFAQALAQKVYSETGGNNQGTVIELIDALRHILDLQPNDPETLLSMANINYNFQVFDKAAEYFDAYLKINKDDHLSRSTFGSALSFLGRFDDAEKELLYVLAKDPAYFLARANLAIAYGLSGDKDAAQKAAKEAVLYAKDEETKTRFNSFLAEILNPKPIETREASAIPQKAGDPKLSGIESDIRANSVAGPKFVYAKIKTVDTLELNFANFPMKAMPPFAKEKFFNTIKESVLKSGLPEIKSVIFVDHGTNEIMETLKIQ